MTEAKAFDAAIVGEIYADHVFSGFEAWPKPGEEITTEEYVRELGGGAATTACALGRLGRKVTLIGTIATVDKAWAANRLAQFGVDASGLTTTEFGATGVTVSISTRTDRSFFTHVGVNKLLPSLLTSPSAVAVMSQARHVHFAMPLPRQAAKYLLPILKAANCTVSLDVGCQPIWLGDSSNNATMIEVDYFLPNEKEGELWSGRPGEDAFFAQAKQKGLIRPVLKLGRRGAQAECGEQRLRATPPAVNAIDTTGAGDAFDAGFIDGILDGAPLEQCLHKGCIVGALSTRAAGGLGALPDRNEEKKYAFASVN